MYRFLISNVVDLLVKWLVKSDFNHARDRQSGKISHAYLFSGPRGTGKTSAVKIFAAAMNCPNCCW